MQQPIYIKMKKLLLLSAILFGLSIASFSQTSPSPKTGKWNFGIDAGLPLGNQSRVYSSTIGGYVKYEYPVSNTTFLTLSTGFNRYIYTNHYKNELKYFGDTGTGDNTIPVNAGVKHYFGKGLFAEAQAGAAFYTAAGAKPAFIYSAGVGYTFKNGVEVGVRYEGLSQRNNFNFGVAAVRLGFRF